MASCPGGDVLADSPTCPGCGRVVDRYRDELCGRVCFRFVPHVSQVSAPPAELVDAILSPFDDLEATLIHAAQDLQTVASAMGDLTNPSQLHALQVRVATVSALSESIEIDLLRLRKSAAA